MKANKVYFPLAAAFFTAAVIVVLFFKSCTKESGKEPQIIPLSVLPN